MKIRKTQLSRSKSFAFAFLLVLAIAWIGLKIVLAALDASSPFKRYLDTNVIADLVMSVIVAFLVAAFSLRKGIVLPRFVFGDDRDTFGEADLQQKFNLDATISSTMEDGWRAEGNGSHSRSIATYKGNANQMFAIAAQFKPLRTSPTHNKWKVGFVFRKSDGTEALVVHTDSHNLLLGYSPGRIHVRLPVSKHLEGRWTLLEVQMSVGEPPNTERIFCHVDGRSYFVGEVPADRFPWTVSIEAWSDEQKHHVVLMRDISISDALA